MNIKPYLRSTHKFLAYYGIDGRKFLQAVKPAKNTSWFNTTFEELKKQKGNR